MYSKKTILAIDPTFDFTKVYKRNAYTLLNVSIEQVEHGPIFMIIDGEKKILARAQTLYVVMYRDWVNTNLFSFASELGQKDERYWTTPALAQAWFERLIDTVGYTPVSEEEAISLAQEYLARNQKVKDSLHKDGLL
jgi:hypothetical protein